VAEISIQSGKGRRAYPVIAVGVIRTPEQAEQLLSESAQDFIGLARPLLADPDWAVKAQTAMRGVFRDALAACIAWKPMRKTY
jgi:2,4-dienoyl-CoA reductase-like NADH-dependent reductase (Old Yellow Enzyme family)